MKRIILLVLVTMFLFVGCTNTAVLSANTSSAKATTPPKQTSATSNAVTLPEEHYFLKDQKDVIAKEKYSEDMTKGLEFDEMYLYSKTNFELKNEAATVELYIDSKVMENGMLFYEDVHDWSLLVRQGDYVYPLILNQKVFIGQIKYALFTNIDDSATCIVVFIQTDAGMEIYEYQFHAQEQTFTRKKIYKTTYADFGYYSKGDIPYIPKN